MNLRCLETAKPTGILGSYNVDVKAQRKPGIRDSKNWVFEGGH